MAKRVQAFEKSTRPRVVSPSCSPASMSSVKFTWEVRSWSPGEVSGLGVGVWRCRVVRVPFGRVGW